jgi:DNA-binding MarR family transcriptional regulator
MNREDFVQEIIENSGRLKRLALADRARLNDLQLSQAQLEFIHLLFFHEPASFKQAAGLLGVSTSAVSQLADSLQAEGYIKRHSDPKDRRVIYMSLSQKGKEAIKNLRHNLTGGLRATLETLDDREIATLSRLYKKMVEAAASNLSNQKERNDKKTD